MRRRKYNNKPTDYKGVRYPSIGEADLARSLDLLFKNGDIEWWVRQVPIMLVSPRISLTVDFLVGERASHVCGCGDLLKVYAMEFRGYETERWKVLRDLWEEKGPFPLHVVMKGKPVTIIPGAGQE